MEWANRTVRIVTRAKVSFPPSHRGTVPQTGRQTAKNPLPAEARQTPAARPYQPE